MDHDRWTLYKDEAGRWRWNRTAPNGELVGASSEGYWNRADCLENADRNGYDAQQHSLDILS